MKAIDAQNKAAAGTAAAQRQLDRSTAANASRTGVTLPSCTATARKCAGTKERPAKGVRIGDRI